MNKSLEERRQFILEAGCCGDDMGGDDAPMDAGEEGTDVAPLSPLQGFLNKRKKAKRKKDG